MKKAGLVSLEGAISWRSRHATHVDRRHFGRVSLWRDILPADISVHLAAASEGDVLRAELAVGEVVDVYDKDLVRKVQTRQFRRRVGIGVAVTPRVGRFYPRNLVTDLNGFFSDDRRPLRCLTCSEQELCVDLNHPLAQFAAAVEVKLIEVLPGREEHGGQCNDMVLELAGGGPGMQASLPESDTDFFGGDPFARLDPRPDAHFY